MEMARKTLLFKNRRKKLKSAQIILFFSLATLFQLIPWGSMWISHIHFYIPLLAFFSLSFSMPISLTGAIFSGLVLDLLTSTPFGLFALNYSIATLILYRFKRFFKKDPISFCLYTMTYSILCIFFESFLIYVLGNITHLSSLLTATIYSMLIVPILDLLYAFLFFALPIKYGHITYLLLWRRYRCKKSRFQKL